MHSRRIGGDSTPGVPFLSSKDRQQGGESRGQGGRREGAAGTAAVEVVLVVDVVLGRQDARLALLRER